ncbi:MAG: hypothetical protein AAF623_17855 [Planctomycetota bacterium]
MPKLILRLRLFSQYISVFLLSGWVAGSWLVLPLDGQEAKPEFSKSIFRKSSLLAGSDSSEKALIRPTEDKGESDKPTIPATFTRQDLTPPPTIRFGDSSPSGLRNSSPNTRNPLLPSNPSQSSDPSIYANNLRGSGTRPDYSPMGNATSEQELNGATRPPSPNLAPLTGATQIGNSPRMERSNSANSYGMERSNSMATMPAVRNQLAPSTSDSPYRSTSRLPDKTSRIPSSVVQGSGTVEPVSYVQPTPPKKRTTRLANDLIDRYSVENYRGPLPGVPVKLVDLMKQQPSINQRQTLVHDYWDAYYDWASLLAARNYAQWLESATARTQAETQLLSAAKLHAANQVTANEIELGKSQAKLIRFQTNNNEMLPLPSDQPLIKRYRTNYTYFQSVRRLPESLRGIDQILPSTLELIADQADAVQLSKAAADQVMSGNRGGTLSTAVLIEAGRLWRNCENDLILSVVNYNHSIAEYALNVTNTRQSPDSIVAMLIGEPKSRMVDRLASPVRTASNNMMPDSRSSRPDTSVLNNGVSNSRPGFERPNTASPNQGLPGNRPAAGTEFGGSGLGGQSSPPFNPSSLPQRNPASSSPRGGSPFGGNGGGNQFGGGRFGQ